MTSLRDVLQKQNVFTEITLTPNAPNHLKNNAVVLAVNFREARVGSEEKNFPVILSVDLTIKQPSQQAFQRHYFVKSDPKIRDFKHQQMDASDQLMQRIVHGVEQWGININ